MFLGQPLWFYYFFVTFLTVLSFIIVCFPCVALLLLSTVVTVSTPIACASLFYYCRKKKVTHPQSNPVGETAPEDSTKVINKSDTNSIQVDTNDHLFTESGDKNEKEEHFKTLSSVSSLEL